jgi:DNA-binding response OmpR family regulator
MPKILVIDDEETIRNLVSGFLTSVGYDVTTAEDGDEGLRLFHESAFDLVITDLVMPKYDGNEIARRIRSSERKTPVIGITATPGDFDKNYLDIIIEKPFSLKELAKYIKTIIGTIR